MPRFVVGLVLVAAGLPAAVIRGTVVENQTSKPLSRAVVSLEPVSGTPANPVMARTNIYGAFEFSSLPAGAYVVKASRRGFRTAEYGQKNWKAAGRPVAVAAETAAFLTLRLPRYGAITGTVLDENDVGLPQQIVLAYRAAEPPELVSRAVSDERGVYRISGLEPGAYLVRTAGFRDEDIDYLPTFSKETLRMEQARMVDVYLEEDTRNVDVRPLMGTLFTISGTVITNPPGVPVSITLASDTGRQTVPGPAFQFTGLPPGPYELYAEVRENPTLRAAFQAAYTPLRLERNLLGLTLSLQPVRESRVELAPPLEDSAPVQLLVRRKDYAGVGPVQMPPLGNGRVLLGPGRWELSLRPPHGYYVSGFSGPSLPSLPSGSSNWPDGWNEAAFTSLGQIKFSLASGAGSSHGLVMAAGDPVAGVPVYLEAYDPDTRKRLSDLRTTRTDLRGMYRFDDLAPGIYRVLGTFEYQDPDSGAMDLATARPIKIEAHSDLEMDLDLYGER